jgi:adenine-specific DNA-methyltransferase
VAEGAFLAPVALKIIAALKGQRADVVLAHLASHLVGWEIDPFGGWLTQVFVEVVLKDLIREAGVRPQPRGLFE